MSSTRKQEFDAPWKYALEVAFDLFLSLFLDDLYAIVDWPRGYDSLEQELQKLTSESSTGVLRVDKLFKAYRKGTGDPRFFHVEGRRSPRRSKILASACTRTTIAAETCWASL